MGLWKELLVLNT